MIKVLPIFRHQPNGKTIISTVSRSNDWSKGLSPFVLGPVRIKGARFHGIRYSWTVENAWQYSKVYQSQLDEKGRPGKKWLEWARKGWSNRRAVRYPMGKGAIPVYSYWDGERLDYIEARRVIYCPLYSSAVEKTEAWEKLKGLYKKHKDLVLLDFDAYDHRALDMDYEDVLCCRTKKMGHAFVLAMMLENKRAWENEL